MGKLKEPSVPQMTSYVPFFSKLLCLLVFGPKLLAPPLTSSILDQPNPVISKPHTNYFSTKPQPMTTSASMVACGFQILQPQFRTN
jgi:hypothetical protein